jgi:hypothetical protein
MLDRARDKSRAFASGMNQENSIDFVRSLDVCLSKRRL